MKKIYVREEVCISCHLCEVYCQRQYSQSKDLIKAFKKELPRPLPRLRMEEKGPVSFTVRCQHCDDSPCAIACLTGAITREPESGRINVDEDRCIGCWTCVLACPLGAIRLDTHRGMIAKCHLCQGEEMPVCVANCPNEALAYA